MPGPTASSVKNKGKSSSTVPAFVTRFKAGGGTVEVEVDQNGGEDPGSPLTDIVDEDSEADAGVRLDPDDSMYHGKTTKNRVATPPPSIIKTRSRRAKEGDKQADEHVDPPPSTQPSGRHSKRTHSKADIVLSGDELSTPNPSKAKSKRLKTTAQYSTASAVEDDVEDVDMEAGDQGLFDSMDVRQDRDPATPATYDNVLCLDAQSSGDEDSLVDSANSADDRDGTDNDDPGRSKSSINWVGRDESPDNNYDLNDAFINDASELSFYDSEDLEGRNANSVSDGSVGGGEAMSEPEEESPPPVKKSLGKRPFALPVGQPPSQRTVGARLESSSDEDLPLSTLVESARSKRVYKKATAPAVKPSSSIRASVPDPASTTVTSRRTSRTHKREVAATYEEAANLTASTITTSTPVSSRKVKHNRVAVEPLVEAVTTPKVSIKSEPVSEGGDMFPDPSTPTRAKVKPKPIVRGRALVQESPVGAESPPKLRGIVSPDKKLAAPRADGRTAASRDGDSIDALHSPSKSSDKRPHQTAAAALPTISTSTKGKQAVRAVTTPNAKRPFTIMGGGSASGPGTAIVKREVVLEELKWLRVHKLPDVCEVNDPALQDPRLGHIYVDAPRLRAGLIHGWSDAEGDGMMPFSSWPVYCSDLDLDSCMSIMEFVKWANYCNLVLVSPLEVYAKEIVGQNRFHMYTNDHHPVVCVSAMRLTESYLFSFPENNYQHKRVTGVFHAQDWERIVAFVCMVFRQDNLFAQVYKDALQISTRVLDTKASGSSPYKRRPGTAAGIRSPAIASSRAKTVATGTSERYTLGAEDDIPVYDCRDVKVDFTTDLDKLATFPRWEGREIPENSFVVVAYTVHVYNSKTKGWCVSFNLHWVMVLGVSDE